MKDRAFSKSAKKGNTSPKRLGTIEIPARREVAPLLQGDLDFYCGLYACVNAIRLASHATQSISKALSRTLFREGIDYLDGKSAAGLTAREGMYPGRQRRLLAHLVRCLDHHGIEVNVERPVWPARPQIEDVFRYLEASLAGGSPVMLLLGGAHDHFSVVAGIDSKYLHLFDSIGLRRIARGGCGVRAGRHNITPADLVSVQIAS